MAFSLAEEWFLGDSGGPRIPGFLANGVFALAARRIAFDIRPPVW